MPNVALPHPECVTERGGAGVAQEQTTPECDLGPVPGHAEASPCEHSTRYVHSGWSARMGKPRHDRGLGPDRILGWFALEQRRPRRVRLRILDAGERHLALSWLLGWTRAAT